MREIKFRAWNESRKLMVEWDEVKHSSEKIENLLTFKNLIPMQYTGLKDKNGKEIYEGDIVRYPDAYMNIGEDADVEETISIGEIKWDDEFAQYYVTKRESIDNDDFWEQIDESEVIGNIYENPELLREEQS